MPTTINQDNTQVAQQSAGNNSINVLSLFVQKIKQFAINVAIV